MRQKSRRLVPVLFVQTFVQTDHPSGRTWDNASSNMKTAIGSNGYRDF